MLEVRKLTGFPVCQGDTPGADQVFLYQDENFGGLCEVFGRVKDEFLTNNIVGNDRVSSVKLGANVDLVLYRSPEYSGDLTVFETDDGNLSDTSVGDNRASSLKVVPNGIVHGCSGATPGPQQVYVYRDVNFADQCEAFELGTDKSLRNNIIADNQITSLKVGSGVQVTLFDGRKLKGVSETFTSGDHASLVGSTIDNDRASSLIVAAT